jgi:hypothetical protein
MERWRNVLPPGMMLDVQYEDVVENLDENARRMVAHCGLEWDDACLNFHQTKRAVRTPSANQVRQPIRSGAGAPMSKCWSRCCRSWKRLALRLDRHVHASRLGHAPIIIGRVCPGYPHT